MSNRIAWNLIGVIAAIPAFGQRQAPAEFEVASIRPNTANDRIVAINVGPGGRFTARGYTLGLLIQRAYGVMGWNITGAPRWSDADRYDVSAIAAVAGNLTEAQLRPMLQALLADRFKLKLHRGSKETAGYALVIARGGAKIKPSADGVEHPDTFRMSSTALSGQGIPMVDLARFVAGKFGLVAVDQTGLKGIYDFKVQWPDVADQSAGAAPGDDPREALWSAVFAAIQDQLGLKFAPQRITIDTLVIDSAEKASEN